MAQEWKKVREVQQKVPYKYITVKTFTMPNGQESDYTTWHLTGMHNVAVLALTEDNRVIIARQYRPGPECVLDEIPGGDAEEGESLVEAAARELREETGYVSDEPLVELGIGRRDAYSNETDHYFLAPNCKKVAEQELSNGEYVEVVLLSIDQVIQNAKEGLMTDPCAVLMAYDRLQELQGA